MRSLREYMPNLDICFHTNHRTTLLQLVLKVSSESMNPQGSLERPFRDYLISAPQEQNL